MGKKIFLVAVALCATLLVNRASGQVAITDNNGKPLQGQARGNNGVNIFGKYEIQVLDSYDNPTYPDGQAAAIYGQTPPLVNASRPLARQCEVRQRSCHACAKDEVQVFNGRAVGVELAHPTQGRNNGCRNPHQAHWRRR